MGNAREQSRRNIACRANRIESQVDYRNHNKSRLATKAGYDPTTLSCPEIQRSDLSGLCRGRFARPTPNTQHPTPNTQHPTALGNTYVFSVEQQMKLILDVMPSHVAWTLKILRKECGISQDTLQEITPFSKSTISLREGRRNKNYPTTTTLGIYCQAYGIRLTEFVARLFQEVQLDTLPVKQRCAETSLCYY
jgi:hypothetical protein